MAAHDHTHEAPFRGLSHTDLGYLAGCAKYGIDPGYYGYAPADVGRESWPLEIRFATPRDARVTADGHPLDEDGFRIGFSDADHRLLQSCALHGIDPAFFGLRPSAEALEAWPVDMFGINPTGAPDAPESEEDEL